MVLKLSLKLLKFQRIMAANYSSKPSTELPLRFVQFIRKNESNKQLGVLANDGLTLHPLPNGTCDNSMINLIKQDANEIGKNLSSLKSEQLNADIELLPPVTNPEKIVCIGLNYLDHCLEQNKPKPKEPMFFSKFASTLVGPAGNVIAHKVSNKIDFEVELAVIIGKEAKNVSKEHALDYVFGYSVAQDISARDWQKERNGGQFLIGKSMDSFCPLGPAIVHKSLVEDPHNLQIITRINGVEKQNGNTKDMIYKIDDIIHELTKSITLKPGDVILTGTPAGVGMHRNPPEYLKPGDVIESEIQSVGKLLNKVVADE
ncbi:fumarylacetoacetate hydrolase domain-containing protein 2 [Episyrphus balteatus]|uniref:fumarylacetoacetate hydrolase domain-containing protein 2 n=1 Tax=Episyrphus balteatus TaxID=286459 RepID=UPI002486327A|nr:fumarylacetoacetate hydrolase domain-containing protein 2 [Episyrphus balteatus]